MVWEGSVLYAYGAASKCSEFLQYFGVVVINTELNWTTISRTTMKRFSAWSTCASIPVNAYERIMSVARVLTPSHPSIVHISSASLKATHRTHARGLVGLRGLMFCKCRMMGHCDIFPRYGDGDKHFTHNECVNMNKPTLGEV